MSQHNRANPKIRLESPHKFRSAYSANIRQSITFPENSRWTKQSFRDECNVNTIMARYLQTGEIPVMNVIAPQYLDVTGLEYQSAMQFVAEANSLFQDMPSNIRSKFGNDPAVFLDFCSQEKNRPEMAEMGLLRPELSLADPTLAKPSLEPSQEAKKPPSDDLA